jgi:hypothetical protein
VSSIFLHCCIARKEADQEKLKTGYLFNRLHEGQVENIYKEHHYWLKAPYADNYLQNYQIRKGTGVKKGEHGNG